VLPWSTCSSLDRPIGLSDTAGLEREHASRRTLPGRGSHSCGIVPNRQSAMAILTLSLPLRCWIPPVRAPGQDSHLRSQRPYPAHPLRPPGSGSATTAAGSGAWSVRAGRYLLCHYIHQPLTRGDRKPGAAQGQSCLRRALTSEQGRPGLAHDTASTNLRSARCGTVPRLRADDRLLVKAGVIRARPVRGSAQLAARTPPRPARRRDSNPTSRRHRRAPDVRVVICRCDAAASAGALG
jgi:hypothetical protein